MMKTVAKFWWFRMKLVLFPMLNKFRGKSASRMLFPIEMTVKTKHYLFSKVNFSVHFSIWIRIKFFYFVNHSDIIDQRPHSAEEAMAKSSAEVVVSKEIISEVETSAIVQSKLATQRKYFYKFIVLFWFISKINLMLLFFW